MMLDQVQESTVLIWYRVIEDMPGFCAKVPLKNGNGPIDTDMAKDLTLPKVTPVEVVRQTLSAIEAGRDEVLADDMTRQVKAGLSDEGIYLDYDPERAVAGTGA